MPAEQVPLFFDAAPNAPQYAAGSHYPRMNSPAATGSILAAESSTDLAAELDFLLQLDVTTDGLGYPNFGLLSKHFKRLEQTS